MHAFAQAAGLIFDPYVLWVILASAAFGLFVGAMPGLTATMATALLVPVTFFMAPVPAIGAIVTATAMAIFAGDIPGALLRIPGTPASAAYADEAYAMTRKGQADSALGTSLTFSVDRRAVRLGRPADPARAGAGRSSRSISAPSNISGWRCLGLTCAVFISTELDAAQGLRLAAVRPVRSPPSASTPRPAFRASPSAASSCCGGVNFIPAMIGMFARLRGSALRRHRHDVEPPSRRRRHRQHLHGACAAICQALLAQLPARRAPSARSSAPCPAPAPTSPPGSPTPCRKKFSKEPEKFGTGHIEGIVDATSANNAALGGAWVPALVFGIPGDSITAIVIGVLYMKGMNPGPTVFLQEPAAHLRRVHHLLPRQPAHAAARLGARSSRRGSILRVPRDILMPIILLFCVVGSFAINNTVFGVGVMLVIGVLAWLMEENGFPVAPAILGLVLGGMLEDNFMTSMIKADGDLLGFFERPIAACLGVVTAADLGHDDLARHAGPKAAAAASQI